MRPSLPSGKMTLEEPQVKDTFLLGLDLGQSADYTALAIAKKIAPPRKPFPTREDFEEPHAPDPNRYEVLWLHRYPLRTSYPAIVESVGEILQRPQLAEADSTLVVDATGVGPPVVDMFRKAGLEPRAITITGGREVNKAGARHWNVPKRDLVSVLQVLLQSERLKIAAALPEAETLRREFLTFKVKITTAANDTYGAWREGEHDDLVLAVALACWLGEKVQRDWVAV